MDFSPMSVYFAPANCTSRWHGIFYHWIDIRYVIRVIEARQFTIIRHCPETQLERPQVSWLAYYLLSFAAL